MDNVMHTALFSINAYAISKILDLDYSEYTSFYAKINALYTIICLIAITIIIAIRHIIQ